MLVQEGIYLVRRMPPEVCRAKTLWASSCTTSSSGFWSSWVCGLVGVGLGRWPVLSGKPFRFTITPLGEVEDNHPYLPPHVPRLSQVRNAFEESLCVKPSAGKKPDVDGIAAEG